MRTGIRSLLLVVVALVAGGCFKTDAASLVGADGTAATRIRIELDLGAFDELFGGLAEEFGGEAAPSITDEIGADLDDFDQQLVELYAQAPELRDRFEASVDLDGDVLITELAVLTEDAESLGLLLDGVLGSGDTGIEEILGVEDLSLPGQEEAGGGGTGIFASVSASLDEEFVFRAEPPASGEFDDDLELEFDLFGDLTPEITISITAPGDIIETNGDRSGRTVTWNLDGTEGDPLMLRSEVDPTVRVTGLDEVELASDDGGFPVALVVILVLVAALVVGAVVVFRSGGPASPDDGTEDDTPPTATT